MVTRKLFLVAMFLAPACMPPTGAAKLHDVSHELNSQARFGRLEVALEHVYRTERDAFSERHKEWGSRVRVVDVDLLKLKTDGEQGAETWVRVGWYRPDEQVLRTTTVRQHWKDLREGWKLSSEVEEGGDPGVFGSEEGLRPEKPAEPPKQFPTLRLSRSADSPP